MYCLKCGKENPDDAQVCSSCSSPLGQAPEKIIVKTSVFAIASFILALLSGFFLCFSIIFQEPGRGENLTILILWLIMSLAAIILGVISLIQIGLSAGRVVATGFAVIGTALPFFVFLLMILIAILKPPRRTDYRMVCGMNLSGIGKAMRIYANDYEDEFPRAGGRNTAWGPTVVFDAVDRFSAFGLSADGSGGQASISSSLYLLVKYTEATPKLFICKGDSGATKFKISDYPNVTGKELKDFWDFGPIPQKHCSYSYHMPYGLYPLTKSSEHGMAVAADRNPWIMSPAADAKVFSLFKPDLPPTFPGTAKQARYGNAITHKGDGQNVLFMDSHVDFEKRPYCGIDDDNIYTHLPQGLGHSQLGEPPVPFISQPGHRKDSLLVHDPPPGARRK